MDYTLKGHISSVKATAYCPWQETLKSRDILLVSVGGRAQMMCWRITAINGKICIEIHKLSVVRGLMNSCR